jgi:hypothetical protein
MNGFTLWYSIRFLGTKPFPMQPPKKRNPKGKKKKKEKNLKKGPQTRAGLT